METQQYINKMVLTALWDRQPGNIISLEYRMIGKLVLVTEQHGMFVGLSPEEYTAVEDWMRTWFNAKNIEYEAIHVCTY